MCTRLLRRHFPSTCLATDMYKLLQEIPESSEWDLQKLLLAPTIPCVAHEKEPMDEIGSLLVKI